MSIRQAKSYKVDLKAYMAECEANYLRLIKLLPAQLDSVRYRLDNQQGQPWFIDIAVKERCKYTTMVSIEQTSKNDWLPLLQFQCRIYHDAKMVEVTSFQRQKAKLASYHYPNVKMLQQDEKYQQHRFLSECLRYCLHQGMCELQLTEQ